MFCKTTSILTAHLRVKANHTQIHVHTNICTHRQLSIGLKKGPVVNVRGRYLQIHHHPPPSVCVSPFAGDYLHFKPSPFYISSQNIHISAGPVCWGKEKKKRGRKYSVFYIYYNDPRTPLPPPPVSPMFGTILNSPTGLMCPLTHNKHTRINISPVTRCRPQLSGPADGRFLRLRVLTACLRRREKILQKVGRLRDRTRNKT